MVDIKNKENNANSKTNDANCKTININDKSLPYFEFDTIIIGSGAAGLNAADCLYDLGQRNIAIVTEGLDMGTSRNTGSDKQTYYKLSLASAFPDSVSLMAQSFFENGAVNGDNAMIEAAMSARCFFKLVSLGVPFPTNKYGEYVGYQTDHDSHQRATSAGPYTSKYMTESLEHSVISKNIKIFDSMMAVKFFVEDMRIFGFLAIDLKKLDTESLGFSIFMAKNIILASGGQADVFKDSVYPKSQTGMTGMAVKAGAALCNLQHQQYGISSTKFRWNLSGTYQQVLPRYVSFDKDGNEYEFLTDYFDSPSKALDAVFLKGYQWPFDSAKAFGSSIIDIIIYHEINVLQRKVFLDYRKNPKGLENNFKFLSDEAYNYLKNSKALEGRPIDRLKIMNPKAIELFLNNDIDLNNELLEINVTNQHINGGIAVDENWQSNIFGLYAVGEVAGNFGITRPGGSALNATQVGSFKAAEHIALKTKENTVEKESALNIITNDIKKLYDDIKKHYSITKNNESSSNLKEKRDYFRSEMSKYSAFLRNENEMSRLYQESLDFIKDFDKKIKIENTSEIPSMFQFKDTLYIQAAMLASCVESAKIEGSSGGSIVLSNEERRDEIRDGFKEGKNESENEIENEIANEGNNESEKEIENEIANEGNNESEKEIETEIENESENEEKEIENEIENGSENEEKVFCDFLKSYKFKRANINKNKILNIKYKDNKFVSEFINARPLPKTDTWFESVWNDYIKRYENIKP